MTLALVVALLLRVASRDRFEVARAHLLGAGVALAGIVAVTATVGSLWFSKGAHFPPCELCWYQRIAMYPLALVLPIAAWRRDTSIRAYGIALATGGLLISAWHNYIETFPSRDPGGCDPTNPCTVRWVEGLGFWTIPRMAAVAFVLILTLLGLDRPLRQDPS